MRNSYQVKEIEISELKSHNLYIRVYNIPQLKAEGLKQKFPSTNYSAVIAQMYIFQAVEMQNNHHFKVMTLSQDLVIAKISQKFILI